MLLTIPLRFFHQLIVIPVFSRRDIEQSSIQEITTQTSFSSFIYRKIIDTEGELQNDIRILKIDLLSSTILATFCARSSSSTIYLVGVAREVDVRWTRITMGRGI
jgi:hypothetical protein